MKTESPTRPVGEKPASAKETELRTPRRTPRVRLAVAGPLAWIPAVAA